MTEAEAIHLAGQRARELNIPWNSDNVLARHRHFWPFPPFWVIETRTPMKDITAIATLKVHERTSNVKPVRLRYLKTKNENAA